MRHPTTGLNEDDLSRLTGSSSSNSSSSSSSSSTTPSPDHKDNIDIHQQHVVHPLHTSQSPEKTEHNNSHFNSTYLPEIINPLEWQKSRKRKDNSLTASQDRKLQRSNSEELLTEANTNVNLETPKSQTESTPTACKNQSDVIRRVSSEDFKRTATYASYRQEFEREAAAADLENDAAAANNAALANLPPPPLGTGDVTKDLTCRTRYETSPARSQRHSPVRTANNGNGNANGNGSGRHRDSDDSECEHERRRSSERFCKTRQPPVRKSGVTKKGSSASSAKYLPVKRGDESAYKYDLSALKYERRGFISSKKQQQLAAGVASNPSSAASSGNDHNDNNLIDFHQQTKRSASISPTPTTSSSAGSDDTTPTSVQLPAPIKMQPPQRLKLDFTSAQETLPWERANDEPAPVLSRRYAHSRHHVGDNIDAAAKLAKVMPYPQQLPKQAASVQLLSEDMDCMEPMDAVRAFSSLENMRTRDVMQQVLPAMMAFQTPEERVKVLNRRITALKKKLVQLEVSLEQRLGYRPSQAERQNDKYMKHALTELSKLRKERHELKTDPIAALGRKVSGLNAGGQEAAKKLEKMKATLREIEQNLNEKRAHSQRSELLEELTTDQLVQEKSAVQHALLYFESLYGHPITKEERDAARTLYERYRQLKRMVSRTVTFGGGTGIPELPTILEHEAMVFESTPLQYSSNNSTETTNSPSDSVAPNTLTQNTSSDESNTTTTTTNTAPAEKSEQTEASTTLANNTNDNISMLSLDQLWEQLERMREEKSMLKATIREYESIFEEQNGRKMLKNDRKSLETETYAQYKEKKAKVRLLQALIKKHIGQ